MNCFGSSMGSQDYVNGFYLNSFREAVVTLSSGFFFYQRIPTESTVSASNSFIASLRLLGQKQFPPLASVIDFKSLQLSPTTNESIIISLLQIFQATTSELNFERLSSPSVSARIRRMQFGYFFLRSRSLSHAKDIESNRRVIPYGLSYST